MFITSSYRKKMEELERWAREEEERTRREEEEEDAKLREMGGRMAVGIMLLAHGEGRGGDRDRGGGNGDNEGGGTEEEHADSPTCSGKR
jgi:hypothetical protein